jgi:hypothetical protein
MEEYLIWRKGRARGVLMVIREHRMKLRGTKPGQGTPTGIEQC